MPITGNGGSVVVATIAMAYFHEWQLNESVAIVNTTSFGGSGWEDATPTLKKWTATSKGYYDHASHGATIALFGTLVAVEFHTDATHKWIGNAILQDIVPKSSASGLIELQMNFTGTGPATYS